MKFMRRPMATMVSILAFAFASTNLAQAVERKILQLRGTLTESNYPEFEKFVIKIGDVTAKENDCRGGEEVMYCSPGQFWADIIVDRKSSACQPVE